MRGIMGYTKCPNCKNTLKITTTLLVEPPTVRKTGRNKRQVTPVEFLNEFRKRSPPNLERRCELFRVLGVYQREGETERSFHFRLFERVNNATDQTWELLSETSQIWANAACFAVEHKLPLPTP